MLQLHHQLKNGHVKVMVQREDPRDNAELREWIKETNQTYPLPEGAIWLLCNEKSEHFNHFYA